MVRPKMARPDGGLKTSPSDGDTQNGHHPMVTPKMARTCPMGALKTSPSDGNPQNGEDLPDGGAEDFTIRW